MGLLEFFKEKANNPSIAGFNEPLLQYQQKKSKKLADSTRHYNQLADTLAPIYKEALAQNPDTDKEALAQSLVRAYSDNIESNFAKEEAQAYNKYRQHRDIDPYSFKRLWDNAPKEQDRFLPAESFDYNTQKWMNLVGADNLQELQQIEINRLKQKRGQDILSLETASDMIDPIGVLLPAGTVAKVGAKGYNLLKSALGGSAIGALVGAQELNRNDTALKDNLTNIALGAGVGGLLNAGLGAVINKATTGRWTGGMLDTLNPNTPKDNPQTAMQGIEISEQVAENLTPNQNKIVDELVQNPQHLQESQTTPQTKPTLAQGVEQILDDNTYPTPKQESAGIEISEQAAENLSKSKDIEARSNALIHNTYANLKAQLDNRQGILQAIREQMPRPNNEAQALQAIREQALREKGTLLEYISEQAREQNLPKAFNKIENHPLLARIKEQMPTTQQATHLPQTPQQIEQLANDLTQLSREYPQVFKGYTPQLKEVLRNNTDTLFKNGALNKDNFRALLERIDAEITPKATESLSVVKKNLTTENRDNIKLPQTTQKAIKAKENIENREIPQKTIKDGYLLDDILNLDENVTYAVVNKADLKPTLSQSNTQFRSRANGGTINSIRNKFNPREHFKASSNFDGIPLIAKDGRVIAGNHRTTAIKGLSGEGLEAYIKEAKNTFGNNIFDGINPNEAMVVRVLKDNSEENIIRLSKLSNEGRIKLESEKLQALGAKYKERLDKIDGKYFESTGELMNYLKSNDATEANRALLDHLLPGISKALDIWEKASGDKEFSAILKDNALNLLHLNNDIQKHPYYKNKNFLPLFNRALESIGTIKDKKTLIEALKNYARPSLDFGDEFKAGHREIQGDLLAYIIKYNDNLTNPSSAFADKIKLARDFLENTRQGSLVDNLSINNYDILKAMLGGNINKDNAFNEALTRAIEKVDLDNPSSIHFKIQDAPKESELLQRLDKVAPRMADATRLNHLEHSLKEAQTRFKLRNKDKENAKLFDKVIVVAQQLGVKFDNKGTSIKGELGHFNPNTNTAKVFTKGEKEAETILHELIHSVTNRALHTNPKDLTPLQVEAINDIKNIFETLSRDKSFKQMYALSSVDEMLSELSNKEFRTMLKGKNILQRIYNAIAKIIFKRKDNYDNLESALYKLIDLNGESGEYKYFNAESPNIHFLFAGEKALLSGEFKPQVQRLQIAKDMLKAGKSDDEIWQKTGWFKGLDDKWRFEINPDFQVSYIKTKLKQGKVLHMRDILQGENKALLKAYPELLEYEIIGSYSKDFSGAHSSKDKIIAISTQLNKFQTNATLAHEIQHAIQEIEGFAKGSTLNEANKNFQNYYKTAGEVEARAVEKRALDLAFKREELEAKESTQSLKSLAEQGNPQAKEILELYDKKNAIFNEFKKAHNALQELKQKGYDDSTKEMQEANQKLNKLKEAFTEHLNLIPERINGKPYDIDSTAYELKKDADLILKEYNQIKNTNPQKSYDTPKENVIVSKHNIESKGYESSTHYKLNPQQKEPPFYSDRNLKERMQFKNPALNDIFYKIAEDIKSPSVFKKALDSVLDKTLRTDLFQDTINSLGFKTSSNKEYMQLREDILNGTNGSVKGVVDFNNLLNAKLSKEQLRELQRYYVGDDYDSKIVTQELKDIADTVMNKINALTQVGIKKGIFPEYYGEMKGYLKRSYEKHTFNAKVPLKSSTLEFHKLFHRGTSKYVSPSTLQRMRENGEMAVTFKDYKEGKWVISENKDSKGNIEIYRDWSKKEREKMGEIEDFSFNAARTIDTLQKQLYTHDFLKGLEAKKIIIKAETNKAPVGYVDTKGDFGIIGNPFKNYYVKAEVASDLKDTFYKLYGDFSKAQKLLKEAVGLWKAGKTIWNPTSHMNNILGNFTFMVASGEYKAGAYLLKNIAMGRKIFKDYKAYKEAKINNKYLKSGSVTESKDMQLLEELERRGYFDKSFLNVIADNYHLKHNGIKAGKENLLKTFHNKLGNVYNAEDVLARFSLAKSFMEEGMEMDKALKLTSEILPDYSKPMPYWLKNADRLGFLPFVQFIYHATPIMLRQINPRAKSIKGDSWNKQALVNILAIGAYAAYQQLITPMPDGYFGSEFVYYQNGDTARTIRIGSIVPHIQMLEFLPGSGSGDWNLLPEFLRKATVGSVYTQGFGVLGNKNYTFDKNITRRSGALGAVDMVGGAIDFAMPAIVGQVYTMANNALTKDSKNRRSKIHNERNVAESALGLLGLNLKSYNKRELAEKKQRDLLKGK